MILGRPYYLTFEVEDNPGGSKSSDLRIVLASELHAEALSEAEPSPSESLADSVEGEDEAQFDIVTDNGDVLVRNNRLTVDDPSRQALSSEEIEQLKSAATGSGRNIIAKIMESHSAINEKTAFSLAKYTLRKSQKYIKRFTVLPVDVSMIAQWFLHEKEAARIMEMRAETLALMASWSDVHCCDQGPESPDILESARSRGGRWLVIDDTAGLVVATLAERMGILYPGAQDDSEDDDTDHTPTAGNAVPSLETSKPSEGPQKAPNITQQPGLDHGDDASSRQHSRPYRAPQKSTFANSNTITVVHPATQPNLSILNYFSYDATASSVTNLSSTHGANSSHSLHAHLRNLSWLQLLDPERDSIYSQPPSPVSLEDFAFWKPNKRGTWYRKRRRWERMKQVVDETREGSFDGLVAASFMDPLSYLRYLVPLLKGGAKVVIFSPTREPLMDVCDVYSSTRRSAFISRLASYAVDAEGTDSLSSLVPSDDFPVDPRLILAPTLQTVRAKEWQTLPGRMHPIMMGRGGAEGYLFTGTRVIPAEGQVQARGVFAKSTKKRKLDADETQQSESKLMNGESQVAENPRDTSSSEQQVS